MIKRLSKALEQLSTDAAEWLRGLPVEWLNRDDVRIVIVAPEYYWGEPTVEQKNLQIAFTRGYDPLWEVIRLLFSGAPRDTIRSLDDADKRIRMWVGLESNWSLSHTPEQNSAAFLQDVAALRSILEILEAGDSGELILIPDTNSLLVSPDPRDYRPLAGQDKFTFLLLPTILGELDELKILHRNETVRENAKKANLRIKGWRKQGSLRTGVTVDRTITVKAEHREPNMAESLPRPDKGIADDRLIASVLCVQANSPCSHVLLLTGDINLENKAEAAFIETREIN